MLVGLLLFMLGQGTILALIGLLAFITGGVIYLVGLSRSERKDKSDDKTDPEVKEQRNYKDIRLILLGIITSVLGALGMYLYFTLEGDLLLMFGLYTVLLGAGVIMLSIGLLMLLIRKFLTIYDTVDKMYADLVSALKFFIFPNLNKQKGIPLMELVDKSHSRHLSFVFQLKQSMG